MAILGVLLGITMTVLGYMLYERRRANAIYIEAIKDLTDRVVFLGRRKALLAEAVATQPKPAGVGAIHSTMRVRTWDQDAPYVEKAKS